MECWKVKRKLGEAFFTCDVATAAKILRRLGERKITELIEKQLEHEIFNRLRGLPEISDLESKFVFHKIKLEVKS